MKLRTILISALLCPSLAYGGALTESRCFGVPVQGRLEDGWRLPFNAPNFRAYSLLGWLLGRTYVHSRVHRVMLNAYAGLEEALPDRNFIYAETGNREGGKFWPHVTHQNGLSVDFMVPVLDLAGEPAEFPRRLWNHFGYDLEFDTKGRSGEYRIDYEALAEHLFQLHRAAKQEGIGIRLVIFAPELTRPLFKTRRGKYLSKRLRFYRRPAKLRHDEHYHVDFLLPCETSGERPE
jgi:penicillin-insensitive murein endopeptidase